MSDLSSRGWDRDDDPHTEPLPLCSYHEQTTEHLSTENANRIAVQCPPCRLAEIRHDPLAA